MLPQWANMLSWWQWAILGIVPPAIVALYFLKLKRIPLEVPSTYLWRKSIEDLHVNSLWQRLRKNLLLWLQLLLLLLIILALLNPSWKGSSFSGDRFVFLVDNSASMSTSDGGEQGGDAISRLEQAKRRVAEMIDAMKTGDAAMVISFSDNAQVVQEYTTNKYELRRRLETIETTARRTSIAGALRLAAGLANPGQTSNDPTDAAAAKPQPAQLIVLSDFRFPDVSDFTLGNLEPAFEMVGKSATANLGIVAFSTRRHEQRPDQIQAFARLENFSDEDVDVTLELSLDDRVIDVKRETIPARGFRRAAFTINDVESGVLRLTHDYRDAFPMDNEAWTVVNVPERSQLLFVSPGNVAWERAFSTDKSEEMAAVDIFPTAYLESQEYARRAQTGYYDLIIYDRCQPKEMPQSNTFFMGAIPSGERWQIGNKIDVPQVIDTERTHPIMQLLEMGNVAIFEANEIKPPAGGTMLIESDEGAIFAIAPREGFEDAVLGFAFEATDEKGDRFFTTNWPVRRSFPVFVQEVVSYLGNTAESLSATSVAPGQTYVMHSPNGPPELQVKLPDGTAETMRRGRQSRYSFGGTNLPGVYEIVEEQKNLQRFAVNLFDPLESNVQPRAGTAIIGNVAVDVTTKANWEVQRFEAWKLLALLGLFVLAFEWYIYNRRVYL